MSRTSRIAWCGGVWPSIWDVNNARGTLCYDQYPSMLPTRVIYSPELCTLPAAILMHADIGRVAQEREERETEKKTGEGWGGAVEGSRGGG